MAMPQQHIYSTGEYNYDLYDYSMFFGILQINFYDMVGYKFNVVTRGREQAKCWPDPYLCIQHKIYNNDSLTDCICVPAGGCKIVGFTDSLDFTFDVDTNPYTLKIKNRGCGGNRTGCGAGMWLENYVTYINCWDPNAPPLSTPRFTSGLSHRSFH